MHTSSQGSSRISTAASASANCNRNRSIDHVIKLPVAHQQQEAQINDEKWMAHAVLQIEKAQRMKLVKEQAIFPGNALFEVRRRSYIPRLVHIGPLYSKLEPSSVDDFKFLCMKEFMGRHKLSLDALMSHTVPDQMDLQYLYFNAPKYSTRTL
ncbi:hypothetical protein KP509_11G038600 [Ceratopteris richardii]|uniref:Uncharacterized protein n=1 Tax=Ceratopteris richardii TaxID=49495 RepID=A0A8T2TUH5_CERRI|nr:hypothetical protein KP509_11G038600 [Ceratopteris richardii]